MFNPIRRIRDIIEVVKMGPNTPESAMEITFANIDEVLSHIGHENEKYAKIGDYVVMFDTDLMTICPRKEFHQTFEFVEDPTHSHPAELSPIREIPKKSKKK